MPKYRSTNYSLYNGETEQLSPQANNQTQHHEQQYYLSPDVIKQEVHLDKLLLWNYNFLMCDNNIVLIQDYVLLLDVNKSVTIYNFKWFKKKKCEGMKRVNRAKYMTTEGN